jgi:hypothetical protein
MHNISANLPLLRRSSNEASKEDKYSHLKQAVQAAGTRALNSLEKEAAVVKKEVLNTFATNSCVPMPIAESTKETHFEPKSCCQKVMGLFGWTTPKKD